MTNFGRLVVLLVVLFAAVLLWLGYTALKSGVPASSEPATNTVATSTATILPGIQDLTYLDKKLSFSIQYPAIATTSAADFSGYLALTQTPLTSFVLPRSMYEGTNLVDAGVYVGASSSPEVIRSCASSSPATGETATTSVTINDADFWVFESAGAGAGNFYETKTYRRLENGWCVELVELLHSGNIANYPAGTVTEFDKAKFQNILEAIVHTYRSIPTGI